MSKRRKCIFVIYHTNEPKRRWAGGGWGGYEWPSHQCGEPAVGKYLGGPVCQKHLDHMTGLFGMEANRLERVKR